MKKMRKILLLTTSLFVLLGTTACSSQDNADNGANQTQDSDSKNQDDKDYDTMNDATGGDGVLDDAVDDVTDGVDNMTDDITDDVDKATDDLTEDNGPQKDSGSSKRDNMNQDNSNR